MMNERQETFTRPLAEDGAELLFRPDLGADVYVHPRTQLIYLELGDGQYQRTPRRAPGGNATPEFPTDRPRAEARYGVDLSAEGYA